MYFQDHKGLVRVACVSGALVFSCIPILASAQRQSSEDRCVQDLRADDGWVTRSANATQQMGMPAHHIATFATTLIKRAEGECRDAVRANPELQRIVANARTRLTGGTPSNQIAQGSARSPADSTGTSSAAECFEKIKNIQSSFPPIQSLQRQKALFEGECRYHPQAKAYVDAADRGLKEQQAGNQTNTDSSTQSSNTGNRQASAAAQAEALTRERAAGKKARDDAYAAEGKRAMANLAQVRAREEEQKANRQHELDRKAAEERDRKEASAQRIRELNEQARARSRAVSAEAADPNAVSVHVTRCPILLVANHARRAGVYVTVNYRIVGTMLNSGTYDSRETKHVKLMPRQSAELVAGQSIDCNKAWNISEMRPSWIETQQASELPD